MFVQHRELTGDNECILPNSNNNNHYCRPNPQIHLLKAGAGSSVGWQLELKGNLQMGEFSGPILIFGVCRVDIVVGGRGLKP